MSTTIRQSAEEEEWLRKWALPEEMVLAATTMPWDGRRRWFSSPNVVPMERYRKPEQVLHILAVLRQRRRDREAQVIHDLIAESRKSQSSDSEISNGGRAA